MIVPIVPPPPWTDYTNDNIFVIDLDFVSDTYGQCTAAFATANFAVTTSATTTATTVVRGPIQIVKFQI